MEHTQLSQEFRAVQQQGMILVPRMIQSMEILQLPILALQARIEQELQENAVDRPVTLRLSAGAVAILHARRLMQLMADCIIYALDDGGRCRCR